MKFYGTQLLWTSIKRPPYLTITSGLKLRLPVHKPSFIWHHKQFYVTPVNLKSQSKLWGTHQFKAQHGYTKGYFLTNRLINNFCSDGKYLKYYNYFLTLFQKLYWLLTQKQFQASLTTPQYNNLLFFLTNLKSNLMLNLTRSFIFFIFSRYEILFFSKVVKLKKKAAKKLKRKFSLDYVYITPRKRLLKTIKFWKFYASSILKYRFVDRLLFALLNLILENKNSFLAQYKSRIIRTLVKKKKLEF